MLTASWRPALVALNLALLAMIAYFAARITASSVAARLEHPTAAAGSRAAAAPAVAAVQPESAYAVIYERDAFNAVTKDQKFLADAAKQKLLVTPMSGEEAEKALTEIYRQGLGIKPRPFIYSHVVELIDGKNAHGRCYLTLRSAKQNMAVVGAGHYADTYVKAKGIQRVEAAGLDNLWMAIVRRRAV